MECIDCIHWYQGPGDDSPCCQVKGLDGTTPCEDEEREDEE